MTRYKNEDQFNHFVDADLQEKIQAEAEKQGLSEGELISELITIVILYGDRELSTIIEQRAEQVGMSKDSFAARIFTHLSDSLKSLWQS